MSTNTQDIAGIGAPRVDEALAARPRKKRDISVRWIALTAVASLVGLYLILPTLLIIPMSFSDSSSLGRISGHWTLKWYQELVEKKDWARAAGVSLQVAALSTILATVLGTAATFGLFKLSPRVRAFMQGTSMAPLIIPPVIIGIGVYILMLKLGLFGTLQSLVIGHAVLSIPFVIVAVSTSLAQFDPSQEQAAAILGARPWTRFRRVVFPQILPGIVAGALFAFVTSWDEVVVSTFLVSPNFRTLPVEMWIQARTTVTPVLAALSTVLMVVSTLALVGMFRLQRTRK
ncbi:ABC transporter permease [Arthrobacter sp. GCM10027362]|uniref:ABC transporter permease n=1 Tax=Arthrobacter sp. GCM10027362 TaxID=3273379 RepID=UPI0036255E40